LNLFKFSSKKTIRDELNGLKSASALIFLCFFKIMSFCKNDNNELSAAKVF